MTIDEDDESLERELFARRERALDAAGNGGAGGAPRLEDVLRAVAPPRRLARRFHTAEAAVFALAACAAGLAVIVPRAHLFAAASPAGAIRPDDVAASAPAPVETAAVMSTVSYAPADTEACEGDPAEEDTLACSVASRPRVAVVSSSGSSCSTDSPTAR